MDSSTYDQPEMPCFEDMLDQSGKEGLRRREDVQISQRIDDPVTGPEIDKSVALEATYHGVTQWVYVEWGKRGGLLQANPTTDKTFRDWAADLRQLNPPGVRPPELKDAEGVTRIGAAWHDADELVIREDAEVVDRIDNPLGYSDPEDSVALAAKVDGIEWWTLLSTGATSHIHLERADNGDFQAWVDKKVRETYSGQNAANFSVDKDGEVTAAWEDTKIIDQITDPDISWLVEPGEHVTLVEYSDFTGPKNFLLVRTRNSVFEGAWEKIPFLPPREGHPADRPGKTPEGRSLLTAGQQTVGWSRIHR